MPRQLQQMAHEILVSEQSMLMDFLIKSFPYLSRNKLKGYLTNGAVHVNDRPVTSYNFLLKPGMKVQIVKKTENFLFRNPYVRVVYEDRYLIVIEKNVGILSMQSDHHSFCVKTLLDEYFHRQHVRCTAHVVHRLDRETSGLMVFAKNNEVQQLMENNWHEIVTDRCYVAVVYGRMEQKEGILRSWLKDDKFYYTRSSETDNGGKLAITHFHTLRTNENYSLVELKLETGRKNQIRVHMQDMNHPVVGDMKYGFDGVDPIRRLGLHAFRLCFIHPVTNEQMVFETPFPVSFTTLFER